MRTWKGWFAGLWAGCCLLLLAVGAFAVAAIEEEPTATAIDDLSCPGLEEALGRSLNVLRKIPPATAYRVAGRAITARQLTASILHLQRLLATHPSPEALAHEIDRVYERIQVNATPGQPPGRLLVTGYYQPVFAGRLDRQPPFVYPLYRVPDDLLIRHSQGKKEVLGRQVDGMIVPYWTRGEIERLGPLLGQELVWLKDPFDAFVLHIQGSGIIRLADGSRRGVHYAINNGRPYRSVGAFMVSSGRMQLADVTMDSLRRYIEEHPAERDRILHRNDSFIFFDWSEPGPAIGSLGQPLTPGRSLAADHRWYPPGSLVMIDSRQPIMTDDGQLERWQPLRRLATVQDTGSALIGPNRLDIFWGTGDRAGKEAGQMKERGQACLLLLKVNAGQ
ncbi:MAG: MltA domain-containing protein [Desulfobulbus sp.]|jgi:membrane-bound lytic murein transglycosylase A|uniref:MltA domain-containing protein n=1 Tax=Desulfobulbus sp. TaxID=895 RepID=UPI00284CCD0B|nr:MltA domain-containing protein [Desulfobulbus sp.]MDR2549723.1 MltA domain-containing protein [Desulfobulbus sp.]